jgi:hypothetical protein
MLARKYVFLIARAIGNSKLTRKQRGHLTELMLNWLKEDNPALNVKAFRIRSRTEIGVNYDLQDND